MTAGLLGVAARVGLGAVDVLTREVLILVAAMPVALSASALAQRFGADALLAARGILLSTLLALATVPVAEAISRAFFSEIAGP